MNFFLIANNEEIKDKTIEDLPIKEEDVVILYNKQIPLKWKKIKEHKNKWLFLRAKEGGYHGENLLSKNKDLYSDIILTGPFLDQKKDNFKIKIKDIKRYSYEKDINELGIFKNDKSPQTGLVSFIYIKNKFSYENIYLIGFTNNYKTGIWHKHSKDIEQSFYRSEIKNNKIKWILV